MDRILEAVKLAAAEHDLVLINAGSSAGSEDYTAAVVEQLGTLLVHGVAVRPGHPVILGLIDSEDPRQVPVIGVPGYPVSAALTGEIFVEPLLARWLGRPPEERPTLPATMTRKVRSPLGDDEYLRVTVGQVGDRNMAAPLPKGAGVISSLVRADGIVRIPAGVQGIQAGEETLVHLYRSRAQIARTIVALGSHDLTLDLLAQHLAARGARLTSSNLGSLGGLIALRRGEAHLAGSHLLDPESGEFNLDYIRRYLPGVSVVLLGLVHREQGLITAPGNPKGLTNLQDIAGQGIRYVNRQRGAGTRLLFDYHLQQAGLHSKQVAGYEQEEVSHMTVAAAVASGRADCGLGIRAAAEALNLGFVPLYHERYDLVIPREHYESPKLRVLLEVLNDPHFRAQAAGMAGYDISPMGRVIAELEG
jgi:putative molybdopterin biosynthesis protein